MYTNPPVPVARFAARAGTANNPVASVPHTPDIPCTATAPIASNIASHVTAVATFGDPRHVTNQSFDLGTSTRNGRFPRSQTQLNVLAGFASRIAAWCDANDTFCAGGNSLNVHLTYLNRYQNAAASFVLGKVGG